MVEALISDLGSIQGELETKDFYQKVRSALEKFPDGHLEAYWGPELDRKKSLPRGFRGVAAENDFGVFEEKRIRGKKIAVIRLESFGQEFQKTQMEALEKLKAGIKGYSGIVFDLRENSGGFTEVVFEFTTLLWGERNRGEAFDIQYYPVPVQETGKRISPIGFALRSNIHILNGTTEGKRLEGLTTGSMLERLMAPNEYVEGTTRKYVFFDPYSVYPHVEEDFNTLTYEDIDPERKGFPGRIVLITDRSCASACEVFLEHLEAHPGFHHVGERTAGAVQFRDIGYLVLPNSKVDSGHRPRICEVQGWQISRASRIPAKIRN